MGLTETSEEGRNLQNLWQVMARRVYKALESGDLGKAHGIARRYVRLRPTDDMGWVLLHRIWRDQGEHDRAEEVLREGLGRNSQSVALSLALADMKILQADLDGATLMLADLAGRAPVQSLVLLMKVAVNRRDWPEAKCLATTLESQLDKTTTEGFADLVTVGGLLLAVPGEREHGIALLKQAASTDWRDPDLQMWMHLLLHDSSEAEEHLRLARRYWQGSEASFQERVNYHRSGLDSLAR